MLHYCWVHMFMYLVHKMYLFLFSHWVMSDFCDPIDCMPLLSVHGISQIRILDWVAIFFSRRSLWHRDQTHISYTVRWILYHWKYDCKFTKYFANVSTLTCNYQFSNLFFSLKLFTYFTGSFVIFIIFTISNSIQ